MKNKGFPYTVPSDRNALTPFFPEETNFRYIKGFKSGRLRGTRMDFQSETVSYNYPQVTLRKTCGNGGVQVYPNPTSSNIHFVLTTPIAQNSKIIVRNVLGQLVHENILPENTTEYIFDTQHLSEGVLFYEIQTVEKTFKGKFVTVK